MKSYTDIEQSKVLSKILPLESADMCCFQNQNGDINYYGFPFLQGNKVSNPIPCWSLASLLSVLDFPSLTQNKEDEWEVCVPNHKFGGYIEVSADNPVDACYGMIIRLKERNLI